MAKLQLFFQSLFVILAAFFCLSHADVGTAAQYKAPYLPTACYGNDSSQLPSSNLFASVNEDIWYFGAACARQYLVRCISAAQPGTCKPGQTVQVKIVDRALSSVSRPSQNDATLVLSTTAFEMIANPSASFINIEFQQ
ncbi:EG45-like domain containing protein [Quercus robur]|uniref:Expansin-like EG45 domain-containing protein n=1 Tax=Quercus lobata TaxID=97700 RepID=A0A7N2KU33_QUELO|nr:EG45-like domain containing protein [Quercus robur]